MDFLFPNFLWALALLALPIIIHLFYFRRYKTVIFSNVRDLKEVKEETSNRNRLRNLLVLLTRLLALAALIMAFVQPILGKKDLDKGKTSVSIFLDNSFSMNDRQADIPLLDIAKQYAREIINAHNEHDNFQVITQEMTGGQQRFYTRDEALELIEEVKITPNSNSLPTVLNRQQQLLSKEDGSRYIYTVSDFQKNRSSGLTNPDSSTTVKLLQVKSASQNNVAIDSVWLETIVPTQGQQTKMVVRLRNHGKRAQESVRLSSIYNNQQRPEGTFDIDAKSAILDTVNITLKGSGWHNITLSIEDYPVTFDNTYYTSIYVPEDIDILNIHSGIPDKYIERLEKIAPGYTLRQQSHLNIDYNTLNNNQLIILDDVTSLSSGLRDQLNEYVRKGGNLLVFPKSNGNVEDINLLLRTLGTDTYKDYSKESTDVYTVNTNEFIFSNVYSRISKNITLPKVSAYYNLSNFQRSSKDVLLKFRNGKPYVSKYTVEEGRVYLSSSPLSTTVNDLVKIGEVFVPMIIKMAISRNKAHTIAYTIGDKKTISMNVADRNSDALIKLIGKGELIPRQVRDGNMIILDPKDQVQQEGYYEVKAGESTIGSIAYNFNRKESDSEALSSSELATMASTNNMQVLENTNRYSFSSYVKEKNSGKHLWRYLIIAALVFLLLETLILRFWKTT